MFRIQLCFVLLLSIVKTYSQDLVPHYSLLEGQRFFLQQEMKQNTETDNMEITGNVSLDIYSTLIVKVESAALQDAYLLSCHYEDLGLSFFSPQTNNSISSQNQAFSPLKVYLSKLEKQKFSMLMSKYGEIITVFDLDSTINTFYLEQDYVPIKHELLIKTVKEAFGEEALRSLGNIALNVYNDSLSYKCTKETSIYFNAKAINIINNLYYLPLKDGTLRVQGIGVIQDTKDIFTFENMSLVTSLKGNQTYDYMYDGQTGWMIKGVSKQKIHALSTIDGHKDLPQGLQIPSFTESEFSFKGGMLK